MNVLVLVKTLDSSPEPGAVKNVGIARLDGPQDVDDWLALRERAFLGEIPPVRPWSHADFRREFESEPQRVRRVTWLARMGDVQPAKVCGAVSVSLPRVPARSASLHWLMVDPNARRLGIGSLLLKTAERYCWEQGCRTLRLETHRGWQAAVRFYTQHGYEEMRRRPESLRG